MSLLIKVPSHSSHPQNSTPIILHLGQIDIRWMQNYLLKLLRDSRICWRIESSSRSLSPLRGRYCCKLRNAPQGIPRARCCAKGAEELAQGVLGSTELVQHTFFRLSVLFLQASCRITRVLLLRQTGWGIFPSSTPYLSRYSLLSFVSCGIRRALFSELNSLSPSLRWGDIYKRMHLPLGEPLTDTSCPAGITDHFALRRSFSCAQGNSGINVYHKI